MNWLKLASTTTSATMIAVSTILGNSDFFFPIAACAAVIRALMSIHVIFLLCKSMFAVYAMTVSWWMCSSNLLCENSALCFFALRFSALRFSALCFSALRFSALRFSALRFSALCFSALRRVPGM